MGAKVIPSQETIGMLRDGMTLSEIAAVLFDQHHIDVTPSAIGMLRLRDTDLDTPRMNHPDLIPWEIKKLNHRHKTAVQRLRAAGRLRAGRPLTPRTEGELRRWVEHLAETNAVVHYEPATDQGWFYVPRREGIDTDLIRNPYLTDSGERKSKAAQRKAGLRVIRSWEDDGVLDRVGDLKLLGP